jgi:predicted nucleotidyltransferase
MTTFLLQTVSFSLPVACPFVRPDGRLSRQHGLWPVEAPPGSMSVGGVAVVEILQDKREAIAELCVRHGVARLDVFGSALRDDYRPGESDVDLLVEFAPMDGYAKAVAYFDLLDDLRALLRMDVDLVMVGAVKNRYIARDIERTRQLLYAA